MRSFGNYTSLSNNIDELIKNTLTAINWKYTIENNNTYVINFPMNWYTWGSTMKIKVTNDRQCNIEVTTKLYFQIIDWGDGNRKIKKIIDELQNNEH